MALFCIPSYFAIKSTIAEQKYKSTQEIKEWITQHKKSIFQKDGFKIPQSVRFHINLYDENKKLLYKGIEKELDNISFKIEFFYPDIYYNEMIKSDDKLYYLVVKLQLNYAKIVFITTVLFFIVLILLYLMSYIFAHSSIYPYKRMQKYMNDFFNDSMHELKTPLGVIGVNVELMSNYASDSKHLQRIRSATKQMQMTYEDVEYYIKNKKLKYKKESINLSEYLAKRVAFFADIALPKEIGIKTKIDEDIYMYISQTQIQRIIDNTISNAIKYSHFKGVVEVSLTKLKDGKGELSVKDYGHGIKDLYKVFRRFEREDVAQGGFGLGLNIVQNICNENDIELKIESYENQGSLFSYLFHLDKKKILDMVEREDNER